MSYAIFLAIIGGLVFLFYRYLTRDSRVRTAALAEEFPVEWRRILMERVAFYLSLTKNEKQRFEESRTGFPGPNPHHRRADGG